MSSYTPYLDPAYVAEIFPSLQSVGNYLYFLADGHQNVGIPRPSLPGGPTVGDPPSDAPTILRLFGLIQAAQVNPIDDRMKALYDFCNALGG